MNRFSEAVAKALKADAMKSGENQEINFSLEIVPSEDMPELSVIDYLM